MSSRRLLWSAAAFALIVGTVFVALRALARAALWVAFIGYEVSVPILAFTVLLWLGGRAVNNLKEGKPTRLTVIGATRVAAAALAASSAAIVLGGIFAGTAAVIFTELEAELRWELLLPVVSAFLSSALLGIVGLWVESVCSIDDSDPDLPANRAAAAA